MKKGLMTLFSLVLAVGLASCGGGLYQIKQNVQMKNPTVIAVMDYSALGQIQGPGATAKKLKPADVFDLDSYKPVLEKSISKNWENTRVDTSEFPTRSILGQTIPDLKKWDGDLIVHYILSGSYSRNNQNQGTLFRANLNVSFRTQKGKFLGSRSGYSIASVSQQVNKPLPSNDDFTQVIDVPAVEKELREKAGPGMAELIEKIMAAKEE